MIKIWKKAARCLKIILLAAWIDGGKAEYELLTCSQCLSKSDKYPRICNLGNNAEEVEPNALGFEGACCTEDDESPLCKNGVISTGINSCSPSGLASDDPLHYHFCPQPAESNCVQTEILASDEAQ